LDEEPPRPVLKSATETGGGTQNMPTESLARLEQGMADAEAWREHEALATAEGMPAGQLDEDPPPPVVKSTAAGE
jgi:hypothetical protein